MMDFSIRIASWIGAVLFVPVLGGCMNPWIKGAPPGWSRTLKQAQRAPHGAWTVVRLADAPELAGELIAAEAANIVLGLEDEFVRFDVRCVRDVFVADYDNSTIAPNVWVWSGALLSGTNGILIVVTLPAWIATGLYSGHIVATEGHARWSHRPGLSLAELGRYARFPQGLPDAFFSVDPRPMREAVCARVFGGPS